MNYKHLLKDIGLSDNETEVYLILLELNQSIASKIAEKTKISRPHVYDSLNKLIEKGMISYVIKDGKRYFRPTNPNKILDYIKEKEKDLKAKEKEIKKILPDLKKLIKPLGSKPKVEVYEGPEGLKTILNDMVQVGEEILAFNTIGDRILEYLPEYVIHRYYAERKRKKIKSRQFYSEDVKLLKHSMATYKKLPHKYNPVLLFVYGNKVGMFILTEDVLTIKIEDKNIAKLYKDQFEYMWKLVK